VGSGEKSIKEEAKDACARPHSGIRLSVINEVNKDSTEDKPTMIPQTTMRRPASEVVVSPYPPPTIARVACFWDTRRFVD
jgi:hypothetical protein